MTKMKLFKQTGSYHRKKNICCQDSAAFLEVSRDIAVAAVSDGCSSSLMGHIGSVMCVRTFIETFSALPEEKLKKFCISKRYDNELKEMLTKEIVIICGYNYTWLFGNKEDVFQHVSIVVDVFENKNEIILLDPGPKNAGYKSVLADNLFDAIREAHDGLWCIYPR